jgi:hypothetical protein
MTQQSAGSVTARIPEWLAAEIYEIQHERRRARQPVPSAGDLLCEAWEQRKLTKSDPASPAAKPGEFSPEDLKLINKFLRWLRKPSNSKTHKGIVQLILMELENE